MKTRQGNHRKKYGPNIVRAWFDTVFQYVLGRLASERGYLLRRNWTFRFYKRTLEYVASLGEHMPASARANLEQFASFFPEVNDLLEAHDRKVAELTASCAAFHEAIIDNPAFQEVFADVEREAPAALSAEFSSHFGAFSDTADFAAEFAKKNTLIVNSEMGRFDIVKDLPPQLKNAMGKVDTFGKAVAALSAIYEFYNDVRSGENRELAAAKAARDLSVNSVRGIVDYGCSVCGTVDATWGASTAVGWFIGSHGGGLIVGTADLLGLGDQFTEWSSKPNWIDSMSVEKLSPLYWGKRGLDKVFGQ